MWGWGLGGGGGGEGHDRLGVRLLLHFLSNRVSYMFLYGPGSRVDHVASQSSEAWYHSVSSLQDIWSNWRAAALKYAFQDSAFSCSFSNPTCLVKDDAKLPVSDQTRLVWLFNKNILLRYSSLIGFIQFGVNIPLCPQCKTASTKNQIFGWFMKLFVVISFFFFLRKECKSMC